MIIFDFDQTLFDTHAFKKHRAKLLLEKCGVTDTDFWETYAATRSAYSDNSHATALASLGHSHAEVLSVLQDVSGSAMQFVYQSSKDALASLRNLQQPLMLFTYGNKQHQERVVNSSGLAHFFDHIVVAESAKHLILAQSLPGEAVPHKAWFINDKIEETIAVVSTHSWCVPLLHKPPEVDSKIYEQSGLPWFDSLLDISKHIIHHS